MIFSSEDSTTFAAGANAHRRVRLSDSPGGRSASCRVV
jgi:hypothetical protein